MSDESPPKSAAGPPRLVCRCIGVASPRIIDAIQRDGLTCLEDVQKRVRAGTGCGTCHAEIEEIFADLHGQEVPKLTKLQNRQLCHTETVQRVEGSLYGGIVPKLADGTRVDLVAVKGLQIDLHLTPDDPEIRELIREKLCKFVCQDLLIRFS